MLVQAEGLKSFYRLFYASYSRILIAMSFLSKRAIYWLNQRFPTWGTCTPRCTFVYPKGYI